MANMVWGVEKTVANALGVGTSVTSAQVSNAAIVGVPTQQSDDPPLYRLSSSVPANWIPFIPCKANENARTTFNQAKMITIDTSNTTTATAAKPDKLITISAQTSVLKQSRVINDEEVSKAGTFLRRAWQRTRWIDGTTYCWLSNYATTSTGEGSSGLQFDYLI